jgi:hypothetical protein
MVNRVKLQKNKGGLSFFWHDDDKKSKKKNKYKRRGRRRSCSSLEEEAKKREKGIRQTISILLSPVNAILTNLNSVEKKDDSISYFSLFVYVATSTPFSMKFIKNWF